MGMVSYKTLISGYIFNEYARIEKDISEAESHIRWGDYCAHDVAHLQLLRCRFDCFKEFANNIMILCHVSDSDVVDYVSTLRKEIFKKENRKGGK